VAPGQLLTLIHSAGGAHSTNSDADLLGRFVASQDDGAFAELVRRYSRLVWGQCRHLLANEADADDAFQATFLALAKSAGSIRSTDRLGPWLHAVAHRVCLNARRAAARRTKRERGAASAEGDFPVADSTWDRAAAALHEEIHKLPESQRVAFILCCIEGIAPTVAAVQLGLKWGTFSTRLSRAKQRLIDRLSVRGFGAALAVGAVGYGAVASAALVERAIFLGSGGASIPASVLSLTTGVGGMLMRTKLTMAVAFAMLAVGAASLVLPANQLPTALPVARAAPVPVDKEAKEAKAKELEGLWAELYKDEPEASTALLKLFKQPIHAVPFLQAKLRPLKLDEKRCKELLKDLGNDKEKTWKAAWEELDYLDPRLAIDLLTLMNDITDLTSRSRMVELFIGLKADSLAGQDVKIWKPQPDGYNFSSNGGSWWAEHRIDRIGVRPWSQKRSWTRAARGMAILEQIGSPDAVKVLNQLAEGHADASPTKAAKESLERLKKK